MLGTHEGSETVDNTQLLLVHTGGENVGLFQVQLVVSLFTRGGGGTEALWHNSSGGHYVEGVVVVVMLSTQKTRTRGE